ncbi:MAG TPA: hypothetical protein DCS82_12230 [Rhodospirillaceae bacterium]|nr:hypothetical protein [Rhodospirillaceae bacterium]HAT36476.1 hypothetical protein [Rhodospirillaceae bacterium]|tara:strand:+ start:710 stop:1081 length:372 start_codon:yes stop_codon:yes gene_type:complete
MRVRDKNKQQPENRQKYGRQTAGIGQEWIKEKCVGESGIKSEDSPAKRIYFMVQMLYMFPEKDRYYQQKFNQLVKQFVDAVPSSAPIVLEIGKSVIVGDVYGALKKCRKLMKYEEEVLKHVTG